MQIVVDKAIADERLDRLTGRVRCWQMLLQKSLQRPDMIWQMLATVEAGSAFAAIRLSRGGLAATALAVSSICLVDWS